MLVRDRVLRVRYLVALLGVLEVCGCSVVPRAGPTVGSLKHAESSESSKVLIVPADKRVVEVLSEDHWASFSSFPHQEKPPSDLVGQGDIVSVQIYEPGSGGLFGAATAANLTATNPANSGASGVSSELFPRLVVDRSGAITVPFAGRISAVGKTPEEIQSAVEEKLKGKAISPQALVSVVANVSNTATIDGDVKASGRYPLTLAGERVRDIIDLAGGATFEPQDTFVQLMRGNESARVLLERVIDDSKENIYVYPGDKLALIHKPRTVMVLGATGQPAEIPLIQTRVSLVQVLARAGWLRDEAANPAAVYLLRLELPDVARQISDKTPPTMPNGMVPVIYHLDFSDPKEFFVGQSVEVRDGDMIYIPDAAVAQAAKLAALFQQFTGVIYDIGAFSYFAK
jgi:polysaccharide biosynthesis/export protein